MYWRLNVRLSVMEQRNNFLYKDTSSHTLCSSEGFPVYIQFNVVLICPCNYVLCSYIAYQFVLCHRATTYTIHGTIVPQATIVVGSLYFFFPCIRGRMEVGTYVYICKFRYQFAVYVFDSVWFCYAYGIGHGYGFDA